MIWKVKCFGKTNCLLISKITIENIKFSNDSKNMAKKCVTETEHLFKINDELS